MPAPKKPNTAAAAEARRRIGFETMARKLREAGWTVNPPDQPATNADQPPRPPADYVPYQERRPVALPDSLDELAGPTRGTVELPHHLDWSGKPIRNLDEPGGLEAMYRTVLTEASEPNDLARFINRDVLVDLWSTIWLPPKIRRLWEERFPELAAIQGPQRTAV